MSLLIRYLLSDRKTVHPLPRNRCSTSVHGQQVSQICRTAVVPYRKLGRASQYEETGSLVTCVPRTPL